MKIKRISNNIKHWTWSCKRCGTSLEGWEYEKNDGLCWRCAKDYDPY